MSEHPHNQQLQTMLAELTLLSQSFDDLFYRAAPYERFAEVKGPLLPYIPSQTIYPNSQTVYIMYFYQLFSLMDPVNDDLYMELARQLVDELVVAGMVTESDVQVSTLLVDEYFTLQLADQNFISIISDLSVSSS